MSLSTPYRQPSFRLFPPVAAFLGKAPRGVSGKHPTSRDWGADQVTFSGRNKKNGRRKPDKVYAAIIGGVLGCTGAIGGLAAHEVQKTRETLPPLSQFQSPENPAGWGNFIWEVPSTEGTYYNFDRDQLHPEQVERLEKAQQTFSVAIRYMLQTRPDLQQYFLADQIDIELLLGGEYSRNDGGNLLGESTGEILTLSTDGLEPGIQVADNSNIVIHELTHYLDQMDRTPGNLPGLSEAQAKELMDAIHAEGDRIIRGESSPLSEYAVKDPGETGEYHDKISRPTESLAVAAEAYFENPQALYDGNRTIYNGLRNFFRYDSLSQTVYQPKGTDRTADVRKSPDAKLDTDMLFLMAGGELVTLVLAAMFAAFRQDELDERQYQKRLRQYYGY